MLLPISLLQTGILRFTFEDFIRRCCESAPREILADSAATDGGGNNWRLLLRRGAPPPGQDRVMINLVLVKERHDKRLDDDTAKYSFIVRRGDGTVAHEQSFVSSGHADAASSGSGFMKMFPMDTLKVDDRILNVNGALTIDVGIEAVAKAESKPKESCNPFGHNILDLLSSGNRADVAFRVKDTRILAHKFILEVNAPALARLFDGSDESESLNNPVSVHGTSPQAFGHVLRYVYGGEAPNASVVQWMSKDLIALAHRFGLAALKEEVERTLVESFAIDRTNCVELILFANRHDCSVLKNHAISFLVARRKDMLSSASFERLREHPNLMHEVVLALAGETKSRDSGRNHQRKKVIRGYWKSQNGRKKKASKRKAKALAVLQQAKRGAVEKMGTSKPKPKANSLDRVIRLAQLGGFAKKHEVAPPSPLPPPRRRLISSIAESRLDADKVRSDAKRILAAADCKRLQSNANPFLRMHQNNGWAVS